MDQKHSSAMNGKGFYTALTLCVAMVGAACFYAYNHLSTPSRSPLPESSYTLAVTTAPVSKTHTTTTAVPQTKPAPATTKEVQEAAAILRRTTTEAVTAPPAPAMTKAPVEKPIIPADGDVLQPFSGGELVKSPTTGVWQTHNGMDIGAPLGTEVLCVADGTISAIDHDALWGVRVSVLHPDGTVTRYSNLNENLNVFAGQNLERGTVIGTIGETADAESTMDPHLHFEVLQNGKFCDPAAFFAE